MFCYYQTISHSLSRLVCPTPYVHIYIQRCILEADISQCYREMPEHTQNQVLLRKVTIFIQKSPYDNRMKSFLFIVSLRCVLCYQKQFQTHFILHIVYERRFLCTSYCWRCQKKGNGSVVIIKCILNGYQSQQRSLVCSNALKQVIILRNNHFSIRTTFLNSVLIKFHFYFFAKFTESLL